MTDHLQPEVVSDTIARKLRRERNWFAVGAVAMIAIAMAVSLPRRVQRFRAHRAMNNELLELQAQIGAAQNGIREVEKKITATQQEIRKLQMSPR